MILLIDNYDSFTYNLYQMIGSCLLQSANGVEVEDSANLSGRQDAAPTKDDVRDTSGVDIASSSAPGRPQVAPTKDNVPTTVGVRPLSKRASGTFVGRTGELILRTPGTTFGRPGVGNSTRKGDASTTAVTAFVQADRRGEHCSPAQAASVSEQIVVVRNDALSVAEALALVPRCIVISPGPGRPDKAGISEELIAAVAALPAGETIPLLGVCLGHQALCEVFGSTIAYAPTLMHGKTSTVALDNTSALFAGLPPEIAVARYHSLVVDAGSVSGELRVTATVDAGADGDVGAGVGAGVVMAVEHRTKPLYGVQFHPESILTPHGAKIIGNFIGIGD